MRSNALLILSLLVIVIAAPIVDAIACDDCKDIIPLRDAPRSMVSLSDPDAPGSQRTATAQDLCPVCSNIAAAMVNACCGAPSAISQMNHLPKLLALSDPSYSITKPPQN